jgi:hypothetical protein
VIVTLPAETGFTFTGVAENSFTYTGATTVTNLAESGTVEITFPVTGNTNIPIGGGPSVKLYRDDGNIPLAHNGTTSIPKGVGIITGRIDDGSYSEIIWYVNGNPQAEAQEKTSIILSNQRTGTYLVTVEATRDGVKQSGIHTFKIE